MPKMAITAWTPATNTLPVAILATFTRQTRSISAAAESITISMTSGIPSLVTPVAVVQSGRSAGNDPKTTTAIAEAMKIATASFAPAGASVRTGVPPSAAARA
jgi:hypothetical protein